MFYRQNNTFPLKGNELCSFYRASVSWCLDTFYQNELSNCDKRMLKSFRTPVEIYTLSKFSVHWRNLSKSVRSLAKFRPVRVWKGKYLIININIKQSIILTKFNVPVWCEIFDYIRQVFCWQVNIFTNIFVAILPTNHGSHVLPSRSINKIVSNINPTSYTTSNLSNTQCLTPSHM